MAKHTKALSDFTDAELAQIVREGCYSKGTVFGGSHTRFLIVLAVPYGPCDGVTSLGSAIKAFARLIQDDDWKERSLQIYDHEAQQKYFETTMEELQAEENGPDEPGWEGGFADNH